MLEINKAQLKASQKIHGKENWLNNTGLYD
jgi:hypothetical protein